MYARSAAHTIAIAAFVALIGCGESPRTKQTAKESSLRFLTAEIMGVGFEAERRIAALQSRIEAGTRVADNLERLGWTFVATARLEHDEGFYTLALAAADAIDEVGGSEHSAALLRGHALLSLHRFTDAHEVAHELVRGRGIAADHGLLGDVLFDRGRVRRAARAYQRMVNARPDRHAYLRVALVRRATGDLDGAVEALEMAVRAGSPRDREGYAWTRAKLADYLRESGRVEAAEAVVRDALAVNPRSAAARSALGRSLLAAGRPAAAIVELRRAAELSPLPATLWALEDALVAAGQGAEAAQVRSRILADGEAADPRGLAVYLGDRRIDAKRALVLARAELESRRDAYSWDALAAAELAAGRYEQAWASFERATRYGLEDAQVLLHGAEAAQALGRSARARELLDGARARVHALLPSQRDRLVRLTNELEATNG